jgi:hypothetical protein
MLTRYIFSNFCQTKEDMLQIVEKLVIRTRAGDLSQAQRDGVMKSFRGKTDPMLGL